jgi:hypothetical protein
VSQLRRDSSGDSVPVDAAGAGAAGAAVDDDASQIGRLGVAWKIGLAGLRRVDPLIGCWDWTWLHDLDPTAAELAVADLGGSGGSC